MMDNEIVFSVVVLTYNQKDYIKQTIDSIIQQDHGFRYELILADDCSTDGTRDVIGEFHEKYPEIIVPLFNKSNKGVIRNFFDALQTCRGKYIMECGGDDYWLPGKVKTQIDYMEEHPEIGLTCSYAKRYNQGLGRMEKKRFGTPQVSEEELIVENHIAAVTVCYRRSLILRYIDEVRPADRGWLAEDYPMWLWFVQNSRIHFMNKDFAVYRFLDGSISHPNQLSSRLKFEQSIYRVSLYFVRNEEQKAMVIRHYRYLVACLSFYYGDYERFQYVIDHWNRKEVPVVLKMIYCIVKIPGIRYVAWKTARRLIGVI